LLKRPARKQVSAMTYYEDHPTDGQDYNIWYHKRPGYRREKFEERENPGTRCNVLTDAGKTKASKNAPFCVYFANGRCALGPDCTFQHRIPVYEDEVKLDLAHDIFGRERFSTDREDMGGVGNFSRENRTVYIGCVKMTGDTEEIVKKHFEEWGPIEYVRVIHTKSIAFVRYFLRGTAEFAKEAMNSQALDHTEVLNVRWATEDSNPTAKLYEERRIHRTATTAVNKRLKLMDPAEHSTMYYQITGEYPNTDSQFVVGEDGAQYEYSYPTSDYNEPHPYALMNASRTGEIPGYTGYGGYSGYGPDYGGGVMPYRTAERELAQQEEEEEQVLAALSSSANENPTPAVPPNVDPSQPQPHKINWHATPKSQSTSTATPVSEEKEKKPAKPVDPLNNNQPLKFSKS